MSGFNMTQKIEQLKEFCSKNKITFQDIIKCPFYPLGWYIFCCYDEEGVGPKIGGSNNEALFDMLDVNRGEVMKRCENWRVCFIKNADLASKLLSKPNIQGKEVCKLDIQFNEYVNLILFSKLFDELSCILCTYIEQ